MLENTQIGFVGNRYKLIDRLGSGGMGTVFRATDRLTGQTVALKQVAGQAAGAHDPAETLELLSEQTRVALAREFQALASLHHPHVIQVLDYGFDEARQPFFTMSLIDSPRTVVAAGDDQSVEEQCNLVIQILEALAYVHRRGLVHRDLKPDNVLVTADGTVKMLDFGLAALQEQLESNDNISGTLAYMAPEVLQGEAASPASDLFAVGVMMYELFAGHHPFSNVTASQMIMSVLTQDIDTDVLDVDPRLASIVKGLVSRNTETRYHDAHAVIADISAALDQPVPQESVAIRESYLQAARFVGRQAELNILTAALDNIIDSSQGSTLLIGGESGVGKSRLLDELRTQALVNGVTVMRGQGVRGGGVSYQLWRDPIRRMLLTVPVDDLDAGILKEIVPDIEQLLERSIPEVVEVTGPAHQERLLTTIASLFQRLKQPVLLLLEDLHWAIESLEILRTLSNMVTDLPLLIVGSYRSDERANLNEDLPDLQFLMLGRLHDDEIRRLSVSMLGEAGRQEDMLALLKRETEGNAFFLVEVVRALAEEAGRLSKIGAMVLPERIVAGGIDEVLQRRLDQLPDEVRGLLQVAALAGRELNLQILRAVAAQAELSDWLSTCANNGVLEVMDEIWRFSHDKLREAMLRDASESGRIDMHRQIAEAIEEVYADAPEQQIVLAQHWRGAKNEAKELRCVQRAGEYALRISTLAEAIDCFERALTLIAATGDDSAERRRQEADILTQQGEALLYFGDYETAATQLDKALHLYRELSDDVRTAEVLNWLGEVAWRRGEQAQARQFVNEALDIGRRSDVPAVIARSLNRLGMVEVEEGDYSSAEGHFQDSLEIAKRGNIQGEHATAINNLGIVAYSQGNYQSAIKFFEETVAICRASGERRKVASALLNLGSVAGVQGNLDNATRYFEDALEICRSIGERRGIALALDNLGYAAHLRQDYDRAQGYFEESLALAATIGDRQRIAAILLNMGHVAKDQGLIHEAREQYLRAMHQAREINAIATMLEILIGLAEVEDDPLQALRWLGLVQQHQATTDAVRSQVEQQLDTLRGQLAEEVFVQALAEGTTLSLDTVIDALIQDNANAG